MFDLASAGFSHLGAITRPDRLRHLRDLRHRALIKHCRD